MESNLLLLIRLGVETEWPSEDALQLIAKMNGKEWRMLKEMAQRQGVSAIVLDGVNNLCNTYGQERVCTFTTLEKWRSFILTWTGDVFVTEQANKHQQKVMNDLAGKWTAHGCRVMVFKGQASGTFYPKPEHRSPGDIDCYLFENYAKGNEIAQKAGAEVDESWYKHSQIRYKGEMFENHRYFVHTRDGKRGKRLEKELEDELKKCENFLRLTSYVLLPPVQWSAMFLTYHACAHFISEGLRLKQILDWAMFLKVHQNDVNWSLFYDFCERNHLRRFVDAATSICVEYLGVQVTNPAIKATSPYMEKILKGALYDDDYVFSTNSGWHSRMHLIKNLWTYRWKYQDIYQISPWRQLWYYVTGYLFRTE